MIGALLERWRTDNCAYLRCLIPSSWLINVAITDNINEFVWSAEWRQASASGRVLLCGADPGDFSAQLLPERQTTTFWYDL